MSNNVLEVDQKIDLTNQLLKTINHKIVHLEDQVKIIENKSTGKKENKKEQDLKKEDKITDLNRFIKDDKKNLQSLVDKFDDSMASDTIDKITKKIEDSQ